RPRGAVNAGVAVVRRLPPRVTPADRDRQLTRIHDTPSTIFHFRLECIAICHSSDRAARELAAACADPDIPIRPPSPSRIHHPANAANPAVVRDGLQIALHGSGEFMMKSTLYFSLASSLLVGCAGDDGGQPPPAPVTIQIDEVAGLVFAAVRDGVDAPWQP